MIAFLHGIKAANFEYFEVYVAQNGQRIKIGDDTPYFQARILKSKAADIKKGCYKIVCLETSNKPHFTYYIE